MGRVSEIAVKTLENRRDMYCGARLVCGPCTKMLCHGIPETEQPTVPAGDCKGVVK
jgi:hypothetical protein